jgi:catechol 2,3-dioxygenase-like lactoylglutathione lyase family enzyme
MTTANLGSLLLASADPDRLRAWYEEAFDVSPDPDGFIHFGRVGVLIVERDDVAASTAEPGRVLLNYHVTDIAARAAHLDAMEVTWIAPVEHRDSGAWFGTVADPDGNLVQLIELTPAYWRLRSERHGAARSGPLRDAEAHVRLPAQDLERARTFYAERLGLEPVERRDGGLRYECGGTSFVVFASSGRASGTHTQVGFYVEDIDATVAELRRRGVELLDVEGAADGIIHVVGNYPSTGASGERAAWFYDSEGNLLGLGQFVYDEHRPADVTSSVLH